MTTWRIEDAEYQKNVVCVVCPKCAFTFDADHTDNNDTYSCPLCAEIDLEEELKRAKEKF